MPGGGRAGHRHRALRDRARPPAIRRREPRPGLLRGGADRRLPGRADRAVHQGRPRRGGVHAPRSGHPVLVQAELRQPRHRVPQPLLRGGDGRGPGRLGGPVDGRQVRDALAGGGPAGRPAAAQPARGAAHHGALRDAARAARRDRVRDFRVRRHGAAGRPDARGAGRAVHHGRRLAAGAVARSGRRRGEGRGRGTPPRRLRAVERPL